MNSDEEEENFDWSQEKISQLRLNMKHLPPPPDGARMNVTQEECEITEQYGYTIWSVIQCYQRQERERIQKEGGSIKITSRPASEPPPSTQAPAKAEEPAGEY